MTTVATLLSSLCVALVSAQPAPSAPDKPAAGSAPAAPAAKAPAAPAKPEKADKADAASEKGDIIAMTDGTSLTAPIIKENADTIWVDLAGKPVEIARSKIKEITRRAASSSAGEEEASPTGSLFRSLPNPAAVPERSPKELAKIHGEAVIMVSTPGGLGSGFIIHPEGFAITNAHVIQGETKLRTTLFRLDTSSDAQNLRRFEIDDVEIIAVNNHLDLALIKIKSPDGKPFPTVYVQGAEELTAGQDVFAIGAPLGLERTLTTGVIATTQRNMDGLTFIQTTAQINPGNSGGPLFNTKGEVIGVTNMKLMFMEGLGFAIPARYVRDFIRNRDAFAYDKNNPNSGHNYNAPPPRQNFGKAPQLDDSKN